MNLVMVTARITVRCRYPVKIADLVNLTAWFIEGCPEYIAGRRKSQHGQGFVEVLAGDSAIGCTGDPG